MKRIRHRNSEDAARLKILLGTLEDPIQFIQNRIREDAFPFRVEQWQDELKEKFDLDFDIVSRDQIEASRTGNPFEEHDRLLSRDARCGAKGYHP